MAEMALMRLLDSETSAAARHFSILMQLLRNHVSTAPCACSRATSEHRPRKSLCSSIYILRLFRTYTVMFCCEW